MANFEIVAREDFSDVTYLLEIRHPLMARAATIMNRRFVFTWKVLVSWLSCTAYLPRLP